MTVLQEENDSWSPTTAKTSSYPVTTSTPWVGSRSTGLSARMWASIGYGSATSAASWKKSTSAMDDGQLITTRSSEDLSEDAGRGLRKTTKRKVGYLPIVQL